jgi:hypothetical protein
MPKPKSEPKLKLKPKHHHVYVIELSRDVLLKARFMRSNPNYLPGKPFVYVGMTGLNPDVRFDKHKAGHPSQPLCAGIWPATAA